MQQALDHGVSIAFFTPEDPKHKTGGYYDDFDDKVYLNTHRSTERQAHILVHECQHALNTKYQRIKSRYMALGEGKEAYIENRLRDEAYAFAASFMFAHESGSQTELQSHVIQELFGHVAFEGTSEQQVEQYASAALSRLYEGALGYKERAEESYKYRSHILQRSQAILAAGSNVEANRGAAR